jgi:molecular chaperone GrpE (heat shock protein)
MPVIKSISDLRNRAKRISDIYERLQARLELYGKLAEAEAEASRRTRRTGHRAMMRKLRARLG